jgi:hypothetical protein
VQVAREVKAKKERQQHEQRVKEALRRAAAPPFKKHGKPDMFRSVLVQHAGAVVQQVMVQPMDKELVHYLQRVDLL